MLLALTYAPAWTGFQDVMPALMWLVLLVFFACSLRLLGFCFRLRDVSNVSPVVVVAGPTAPGSVIGFHLW